MERVDKIFVERNVLCVEWIKKSDDLMDFFLLYIFCISYIYAYSCLQSNNMNGIRLKLFRMDFIGICTLYSLYSSSRLLKCWIEKLYRMIDE